MYDRDSKVKTPTEKLKISLWLISKFENADEVLPAVELALKTLKSGKLRAKGRPRFKQTKTRQPSPSEIESRHPF